MQHPQSRYQDTISAGLSDSILAATASTVAPTRTQGILTIGRLQSNTEDVFFSGVSGNNITLTLRGLSQTALTPTEVSGNKKVHNANESLEITSHHLYDANKVRKDEDETLSGNNTYSGTSNFSGVATFSASPIFTAKPKLTGLLDSGGNEAIDIDATASAVNQLRVMNAAIGGAVVLTTAGDDTNINLELQAKGSGKVILEDGAELKTSAAPATAAGIANKQYVDDTVASGVATLAISLHAIYTPAYMTGGASPESNYLLWLGTSNGSVRFTINGVVRDLTGIDFTTGVTSMTDVASKIQTALRAATGSTETVTWNGTRFIVTSVNTTSSSQVSVASAVGSGTDISGAGAFAGMDSDTGHGTATAAVLDPTQDAGKLVKLGTTGSIEPDIARKIIDKDGYQAKGDSMWASAANTPARLAAGADDFGLRYDSSQSTGVKAVPVTRPLGFLNTPVTVANTTTETTLFSASVPANHLGTANGVMMKIWISDMDVGSGASDDLQLRLKFGSTTIATLNVLDATAALTDFEGWITIFLTANGGASVQKGTIIFDITRVPSGGANSQITLDTSNLPSPSNFWQIGATGSAAEDSTAAKTLSVTAQWGNAAAANSITAQHGVCEVLA